MGNLYWKDEQVEGNNSETLLLEGWLIQRPRRIRIKRPDFLIVDS